MLVVECPKRYSDRSSLIKESYSYYAGYSLNFAEQLIRNIPFDEKPIVLDPWNGSGTSTIAAARNGFRSIGSDLNPVMVVIAKARMLRPSTVSSIGPIWIKIRNETLKNNPAIDISNDPLRDWFSPLGVKAFRRIENSIKSHLIARSDSCLTVSANINQMSDLASFFYVTLFRAIRKLLQPFKSSNPTWIKRPKSEIEKLTVSLQDLLNSIEHEISNELNSLLSFGINLESDYADTKITVCSSKNLEIENNSVDLVLTSPPYCTRIDYAVATAAELAVLGFQRKTDFTLLRDSLMGTTTVPALAPQIEVGLGKTCIKLLNDISQHKSVSSDTYYLKNHINYFVSLQKSIVEISRVLKSEGIVTFVVQDSVYKEIHNDLPRIVTEMGSALGLIEFQRDNFSTGVSLGSINTKSRLYKSERFIATESVVSFYKHH